jgi:hypothetical protein
MDVDSDLALAPAPSRSPSSSSVPRGLPFPGKLVDGVHEVVFQEVNNLPKASLREFCDAFHLPKTGNKATLTDRLKKFSADRKEWDGLIPGARNKHRGPRGDGVTNRPKKKKGAMKQSTQRRALLFGGNADSTGSTTTAEPCLPTERSKDLRTDEEKAELLAWADAFCASHPYIPEHEADLLGRSMSRGATSNSTSNTGTSNIQIHESPTITEQLQQTQAQLEAVMIAIADRNGDGISPSPPSAVVDGLADAHGRSRDVNATTTDGPLLSESTATPSQVTASRECPPPTFAAAATLSTPGPSSGPLESLDLGNGRTLCFAKQSVPDPPSISFARDLPRLMRMWDDDLPEWNPSEAVLRIQGEPIALKHWQRVYRYGKPGQWAGTKKNWTHWKKIATSWKALTEKGFWEKFTVDRQPMSYTAICKALKEERMANDHHLAAKARTDFGDRFEELFEYRRCGEHLVRNKDSAVARRLP